MAIWKMAPALAAGNTVVIAGDLHAAEPAQDDRDHPRHGVAAGRLQRDHRSWPGRRPGNLHQPMVDKIAFTGSTEVGRADHAAGGQHHQEGNAGTGRQSPNIILEDADLDIAVDGSLWATFMHNGQACESGTRLFVPASIHDEFIERLVARQAQGWSVGRGRDRPGPADLAGQLRSVEEYIQIGIEERDAGAARQAGQTTPNYRTASLSRRRLHRRRQFHAHRAQEEIFGPVLRHGYDGLEAMPSALANDTIYGLAAGGGARRRGRDQRGEAFAGRHDLDQRLPHDHAEAPFGGYKQSGIGLANGPWGLKGTWRSSTSTYR